MVAADTIETILRHLRDLPIPVKSWHVETGPDATEEDAAWVWATLEDEADASTRGQIRDLVREAIRRGVDGAPWVYVRFRGASELQAL